MPRWPWLVAVGMVAVPVAVAIVGSRKAKTLGDSDFDDDPDVEPDPDEDEDEIYPRAPRDEDECLIIGRDHPRYKFGAYRVCLSANQKRRLFKDKRTQKLGCGVFACAYESPKSDRVVKFTRDSEDVAALLEAQKLGVVPKVFSVHKLKQPGKSKTTGAETTVYALEVERLQPLPRSEEEAVNEQMFNVIDLVTGERFSTVDELCDEIACDRIVRETAEAAITLRDAGIPWKDIHARNIGLDKSGHVKVLDLGITGTKLAKQPRMLSAARQRLAGRRLRSV